MSADSFALAARLGRVLADRRWTAAAAESCTGGLIAGAITDVAGSSAWFDRGFVTYSNAAKQELLRVRRSTLKKHGAVSEETAREMALGALARSRASVAVSVTGVAGPGGGSRDKPVGMVCFGWAQGRRLRSETRKFNGNRESVRRQSVVHALKGVMALLEERKP